MRHSDGKLTDKVYTDENLLGIETAIDVLPMFTESNSKAASPIASPFLGATSQNGSSAGTMDSGVKSQKNGCEHWRKSLFDTVCHKESR